MYQRYHHRRGGKHSDELKRLFESKARIDSAETARQTLSIGAPRR
jgi:hypothetical protein